MYLFNGYGIVWYVTGNWSFVDNNVQNNVYFPYTCNLKYVLNVATCTHKIALGGRLKKPLQVFTMKLQ